VKPFDLKLMKEKIQRALGLSVDSATLHAPPKLLP